MSQMPDSTLRAIDRDRDAEGDPSARYAEALARHTADAKFIDIIDDLCNCESEVMACLARKDLLTLGRIVWNVRAAQARRAASRDVYGADVSEGPTPQQAAAMALYQETL